MILIARALIVHRDAGHALYRDGAGWRWGVRDAGPDADCYDFVSCEDATPFADVEARLRRMRRAEQERVLFRMETG